MLGLRTTPSRISMAREIVGVGPVILMWLTSSGGIGSLLVFEPGVADSVGERHPGHCASGVVPVACRQPVKSRRSSSGPTAPTMIPKRNTVPVGPERR
jgi:hypothetical protein